jgi:hypothetical protein
MRYRNLQFQGAVRLECVVLEQFHSLCDMVHAIYFRHKWICLSWDESYLSNRSLYVNLYRIQSTIFQLLYGVSQGSVLGPLRCILYSTPLGHIISESASYQHLYADNSQLHILFLLLISLQISLIFNKLFHLFMTGCLLIFSQS